MKELRDIKLDLLMGNQNPIVDLFNKITKDIKIINCEVYHQKGIEFIYHKDGEWIFYQDVENEKFWCNNGRYWSLFRDKFDLEYQEIQAITKYLVEEALKREVSTSTVDQFDQLRKVEEALKREVATPSNLDILHVTSDVEKALKREVTPITTIKN